MRGEEAFKLKFVKRVNINVRGLITIFFKVMVQSRSYYFTSIKHKHGARNGFCKSTYSLYGTDFGKTTVYCIICIKTWRLLWFLIKLLVYFAV